MKIFIDREIARLRDRENSEKRIEAVEKFAEWAQYIPQMNNSTPIFVHFNSVIDLQVTMSVTNATANITNIIGVVLANIELIKSTTNPKGCTWYGAAVENIIPLTDDHDTENYGYVYSHDFDFGHELIANINFGGFVIQLVFHLYDNHNYEILSHDFMDGFFTPDQLLQRVTTR